MKLKILKGVCLFFVIQTVVGGYMTFAMDEPKMGLMVSLYAIIAYVCYWKIRKHS